MKKGIDISKWQGAVDFKKIKASGIDFAIIRAGFGKNISQKDPYFERNYKGFKNVGIPVGVYWYSYARTAKDAQMEAKVLLKILRGKQLEYPVFIDLEEESQFKLGMQACSMIVNSFCKTMEDAGWFAGLYISRSPLETNISKFVAIKYCLWIAEYSDKCRYGGYWGIWQYSSRGTIDGINGYCDLDYCMVDYPDIIKKRGLNGFKKPASQKRKPACQTYKAFSQIKLSHADVYPSATSNKPFVKLTGTYWIYDGQCINGRYRITNVKNRCKKKPIEVNVTGFVELK